MHKKEFLDRIAFATVAFVLAAVTSTAGVSGAFLLLPLQIQEENEESADGNDGTESDQPMTEPEGPESFL